MLINLTKQHQPCTRFHEPGYLSTLSLADSILFQTGSIDLGRKVMLICKLQTFNNMSEFQRTIYKKIDFKAIKNNGLKLTQALNKLSFI